jgi:hypothetical protein
MTTHSSTLREPAEVIATIAERVRLEPNTAFVGLVHEPATKQRLVTVERLSTPAVIDEWMAAREEIREVMERLPIPDEPRPPQHTAVTVIARPGLCVFGENEANWFSAWRYSNHLTNAYSGSLILVTEHGWSDFMSDTAGLSPAMAA